MDRVTRATVLLAVVFTACGPSFKESRTPSGEFCSDMPIVPAGQDPDHEYHRLEPIHSDAKARTEAERLESLRKAACKAGADAVIEAVNEEIRGDNAQYTTVSSGTAVLWMRHRTGGPKPIAMRPKPPPAPAPDASAEPAASAAPSAPPPDAKSAKPSSKPTKSARK